MNRTTSPSQRRREDEIFDLHDVLCETYYGMHPNARPQYLETLIDRAIEGDTKVKAVLTCPVLVRSHTGKGGNLQKQYHFRRCMAYPTLPFEAHKFTMETWGVSLFDALALPLATPPGGTVYSTAPTPHMTPTGATRGSPKQPYLRPKMPAQ